MNYQKIPFMHRFLLLSSMFLLLVVVQVTFASAEVIDEPWYGRNVEGTNGKFSDSMYWWRLASRYGFNSGGYSGYGTGGNSGGYSRYGTGGYSGYNSKGNGFRCGYNNYQLESPVEKFTGDFKESNPHYIIHSDEYEV